MTKEILKIKRNNKIIDNIDNGFVVGFFAMIIATFYKPKYLILAFSLLLLYFIIYFCFILPYFNKFQGKVKKELFQNRAVLLFEWATKNNKTEELKGYMEKYFTIRNEIVYKEYLDGSDINDIEIDKEMVEKSNDER